VQDQILTALAKLADLKVISRTSVMNYKSDAPRNLREIGQATGRGAFARG
jgi:TolB-like protein